MRTTALVVMVMGIMVGCGGAAAPQDVVGPFEGTTTRFYVASLVLPDQRGAFSVDLDGDGTADNQLGAIVGGLEGWKLNNPFAADLVAARVIDASVDIISSDPALRNDAHVGVRWNGARGIEGDDTGGVLADGKLTTNAIVWTKRPATGVIELPVLRNADASQLPLESWQLELWPVGDGSFTGELQAVVASDVLVGAFYPALRQMIAAGGDNQEQVMRVLDLDKNGEVSVAEFAEAGLIENLLSPDVRWEGKDQHALSLAVWVRLQPCKDAACTRPLPAPTCHDRIKNGDETQVDCGGATCAPCPQAQAH
jgi:hypothetical protein